MSCFYPLTGYRARDGKVTFDRSRAILLSPVTVACGQCVGCRLERSRQWAMRCLHEASLHDENVFITLTYADKHLPRSGSLDKSAFPKFMKRLRKGISPRKVRFFHAGEYGDQFGRPHYHACLFGYAFPDKVALGNRGEFPVWRSPMLEELWPFGRSEIGSVTFESAAYVARYILKKVTGKGASDHYLRVDDETGEIFEISPEYTTMSRRPGIGRDYFEKFRKEIYPTDSCIVRGREVKPPRYYDRAYELIDPDGAAAVCSERKRKRRREDDTPERRKVLETIAMSRISLSKRGVE